MRSIVLTTEEEGLSQIRSEAIAIEGQAEQASKQAFAADNEVSALQAENQRAKDRVVHLEQRLSEALREHEEVLTRTADVNREHSEHLAQLDALARDEEARKADAAAEDEALAVLQKEEKARTEAHDAVRKAAVGSIHSPLGAWLVQYGWPFPVLGGLTLVLELGAPLALFGRRVAAIWVLGIWSFHVGVIATMAIAFPYPLSGIAFASFFPVEEWLAPEAKLGRFLRRSPALANLLARLLAPASALR